MKYDRLHLVSTGTYLPAAESLQTAVVDGRMNAKTARRLDMTSVLVAAEHEWPAGMAAAAARTAVARAGVTPADVALLLHASMWFQGHDMWPAASYVQDHSIPGCPGPAIQVGQVSNGGMGALELAAGYLYGHPTATDALITTGDKFAPPGGSRYTGDPGTVFGDAGTSLLVSTRGGFARVISMVSLSDSSLERMHRGDDPHATTPLTVRVPLDAGQWAAEYAAEVGLQSVLERTIGGQRRVVEQALAEAETKVADVACFLLPFFGFWRLNLGMFGPLGIEPDQTTWSYGRGIGHLGAGDQIAGLDHLLTSGRLVPGQRIALLGVGAGFSWSCAVVEIDAIPDWATG